MEERPLERYNSTWPCSSEDLQRRRAAARWSATERRSAMWNRAGVRCPGPTRCHGPLRNVLSGVEVQSVPKDMGEYTNEKCCRGIWRGGPSYEPTMPDVARAMRHHEGRPHAGFSDDATASPGTLWRRCDQSTPSASEGGVATLTTYTARKPFGADNGATTTADEAQTWRHAARSAMRNASLPCWRSWASRASQPKLPTVTGRGAAPPGSRRWPRVLTSWAFYHAARRPRPAESSAPAFTTCPTRSHSKTSATQRTMREAASVDCATANLRSHPRRRKCGPTPRPRTLRCACWCCQWQATGDARLLPRSNACPNLSTGWHRRGGGTTATSQAL